jgi:hypothetical protein
MRKIVVGLFVIVTATTFSLPANAANKTSVLTKAFQKYLTDGDTAYANAMADAKNIYEPQISAELSKLQAAQSQYLQVNQVTILKTTSHSPTAPIGIDAINCPITHTNCKDPNYKSNEFTAGEVATTYSFVGGDAAFSTSSWAQMNFDMLQIVDLEVKDGLISLNNQPGYSNAVSMIRTHYQAAVTLSQQYSSVKSAAASKHQEIQNMESAISSAVLSAKRASVNGSAFEKAFVTSFKFEYNAAKLDKLARAPWTYISSLKVLQDAVSVTKQSALADSISANYSYSVATKFNSTYGNLFTSEQEFKNNFQVISGIYKSATGISLAGK